MWVYLTTLEAVNTILVPPISVAISIVKVQLAALADAPLVTFLLIFINVNVGASFVVSVPAVGVNLT